jgi:hypothetical protein
MRERLKARLEELNLLLRITQSVAENLNLDASLPPVLDAALLTTGASGARLVVIPPSDGSSPAVYGRPHSGAGGVPAAA